MRFSTSLLLSLLACPAIISGVVVSSLGDKLDGHKLTARWSKVMAHSLKPRSGHVSFLIDSDLYTFGGYAEQMQLQTVHRYPINDLMKLTFQKSTEWIQNKSDGATIGWDNIEHCGDVPSKRLVSASVVLNGRAYLFGGWDSDDPETGGSIFFDTIHVFDPPTRKWTKLRTKIPDGGTSRHVAFALPSRSKAVIHNHRCLNFVYIFDPITTSVVKQATINNEEAPSSRGLHACCMLNDTYCIIFGGAAQDGVMSNESFLLNTETWEWQRLKIEELTDPKKSDTCELIMPRPRAGHNMVRFSDKCVVVFGGAAQSGNGLEPLNDLWVLHVNTKTGCGYWQEIDATLDGTNEQEKVPSPRNAATLTEVHSQDSPGGSQDKFYVLAGGWAPFRQTYNDTFTLSISDVVSNNF